jgi:hypothetical protein
MKDQRSFEAAMARVNPPTGRGYDDASTLQIRYSLPPEHQYEEIRFRSLISVVEVLFFINNIYRYSQVTSTRRPIHEGLEGYEIANHFL